MNGSLPPQEREQYVAVATLVRHALTDIGLCYRHKEGGLQEIAFSRLGVTLRCCRANSITREKHGAAVCPP